MPKTPNHGYNVPNEGETDWHEPLNENFKQYDTDIEIRDEDAKKGDYEPTDGAKFFATDTEKVYFGDGSNWNHVLSTGEDPIVSEIIFAENPGDFAEHPGVSSFASITAYERPDSVSVQFGLDWWSEDRQHGVTSTVFAANVGEDEYQGKDTYQLVMAPIETSRIKTSRVEVKESTFVEDSPFLHVGGEVSENAEDASDHVTAIENTSDSGNADVLWLSVATTDPGSANNFITFADGSGPIASVEGTGDGNVTFSGQSADYAEYLPRLDPDEVIEPADVVGLKDGAITKRTDDAQQAFVVTERPIVTGNSPGQSSEDRADYETVAFVGQVPVKVRGAVEAGDFVVPSGENDGTGRGVSPSEYWPRDGPVVGQAWEHSEVEGVSEVTVAVGLGTGGALEEVVARQDATIDRLQTELAEKSDRVDALEARLAAVEENLTSLRTTVVAPATADD